jgi:hypothetical protein
LGGVVLQVADLARGEGLKDKIMTILGNALNRAREGAPVLNRVSGFRKVAAGALLVGASTAGALATDPTVDLSAVTSGITAAQVAMVGIAAAIIGAGITVGAIKWGARFGIGLFKIFGK